MVDQQVNFEQFNVICFEEEGVEFYGVEAEYYFIRIRSWKQRVSFHLEDSYFGYINWG